MSFITGHAFAGIQMLPPVQSDADNIPCRSGEGNKVLSWDGAAPIKCQKDLTVSPTGGLSVGSGVRIGQDNAACTSAKEGTIRYNPGTKMMEFCVNNAWQALGAQVPSRMNVQTVEVSLCKRGGGPYTIVAQCPSGWELLSCGGGPGDQLEDGESWLLLPDYPNRKCTGLVSQPACCSPIQPGCGRVIPNTDTRVIAACYQP
ncbi:MAG: hypothetical protein FWF24_06545 [Alphaproteobacteria bacterium]|nr:hypothetical protein [Alphaproteobacteria bacterium]